MAASPVRHPAVAGRFYPRDGNSLRQEICSYLTQTPQHTPIRALACIVPHAGYMYSGHVAGAVFAALEIPQLCLVMCPNHTGVGRALAIISAGAWETPLGNVPIDSPFAAALKQRCPFLQEDATAHRGEHAAEVELPFLQMRQPDLRFVPIALGTGQFDVLAALGEAIADVIAAQNTPVLIVASSDMNHYESAREQRKALRIIGIISRGRAVQRVAIEILRALDKIKPHSGLASARHYRCKAVLVVERNGDATYHGSRIGEFGLLVTRQVHADLMP